MQTIKLYKSVGDETGSLCDFIEDLTQESPERKMVRESLKTTLSSVLSELSDREERVLRLRFGLEDGLPKTLEEVGKSFSVTRERIRQIEAKALEKLRHPKRSQKLKDFL